MIDTARIFIKAGGGGNGCISFRREKTAPKGGPDGGDGGDGGGIVVVGDPSLNTLLHLKYHSTWRGRRGGHGKGKKQKGATAEDIIIPVPVGTLVWKLGPDEAREMVADIVDQDPVVMVRGGSGGAGNSRFATSVNQEPVLAEKGGEGEEGFASSKA